MCIRDSICTARFFQRAALAAVIFIAAALSGYGMVIPADALLLFQKIGAFLGSMLCLEKRIDAGLSTLKDVYKRQFEVMICEMNFCLFSTVCQR